MPPIYDSSKNNSQFRTLIHPIRVNEKEHIHFVTTSCCDRKPFFTRTWTRQLVLEAIEKIRSKKGFLLLGYVLMPEHAHFLIAPGQCHTISCAVRYIKWHSSTKLLKNLRAKGMNEKALWQPRFYDFTRKKN